jgi:DNA-binding LytR/AlgR family response regulator
MEKVRQMLTKPYKDRFIVKVGEHIKAILTEDILYFYSMQRATFLCTKEGKNYSVDYSLDQVQNLVDPLKFFRINRKYIISLNSILDIISYSNSRLKIQISHSDQNDIIVSRERVQDFKNWLNI